MNNLSFQQKIDAEQKLEPLDQMPEEYKTMLKRQISQHAHSEIIGMQPEGYWITRAPSLHRKMILLAKVQDEAGHGLYLYSVAETLGITRTEMVSALASGKAKYASVFNYACPSWADVGVIGWLVDGAAIKNQVSLQETSYGPYARAMVKICKEESFHQRQGYDIVMTLVEGSHAQKQMAQAALNRWWWPALMMFGPDDVNSTHSGQSMAWKIKRRGNSELRQEFIDQTVQQVNYLGLKIPDPNLQWNENTSHYDHSDIDMRAFKNAMNGGAPCSFERLERHNETSRSNRWVRDAATAYETKLNKEAAHG